MKFSTNYYYYHSLAKCLLQHSMLTLKYTLFSDQYYMKHLAFLFLLPCIDIGPYFHGGAVTSTCSAPTVWYFPDLEISFACLWGILVSSAEHLVNRWEERCKQVEGSFKWGSAKRVVGGNWSALRIDILVPCQFQSAASLMICQQEQTKHLEQIYSNDGRWKYK